MLVRDINMGNLSSFSCAGSGIWRAHFVISHVNVTEVVLTINFVGFCLLKIKSHWKPGTLAVIKRLWIAPNSF